VEATSNRTTSITNPARSFGFDSAGNTTQDSAGYTATYNLRGQLATLTKARVTTRYTYNAAGQRVRKVSSMGPDRTVVFVYDQAGHLLGEYAHKPTTIASLSAPWTIRFMARRSNSGAPLPEIIPQTGS